MTHSSLEKWIVQDLVVLQYWFATKHKISSSVVMLQENFKTWFPWFITTSSLTSTVVLSLLCYHINQERATLSHTNSSLAQEVSQLKVENREMTTQLTVLKGEAETMKQELLTISTCATYVDDAVSIPFFGLLTQPSLKSVKTLVPLLQEGAEVWKAVEAFFSGECQEFRDVVKTTSVKYSPSPDSPNIPVKELSTPAPSPSSPHSNIVESVVKNPNHQ